MTTTQRETDTRLRRLVIDELDWTPDVDSTRIGVVVDAGAVLLSGQVNSFPERHHAEQAALRVHGVNVVAEEIDVASPWADISDMDIALAASKALLGAVDVPAGTVHAIVTDHVLTLTGCVEWRFQQMAADRAVRYLRGVRDMVNLVSVKEKVTPADIETAISRALVASAQRDGHRIDVVVDDGAVTLEGTVSSWQERRRANDAAWSTPGVASVRDRLLIDG